MSIKSIINDYKRKKALKIITSDLGRVEETDLAIYCYVDEDKFKEKYNSLGNVYNVSFHMPSAFVLGDYYKVYKDIVYIFDGIKFDKSLSFAYSPNLQFYNCRFTKCISIYGAKSVEFDGNKSDSKGFNFFVGDKVEEVKFIRDHILSGFPNSISINSKALKIIDTDFRSDRPVIDVNSLIMDDSCIFGTDLLKINSDKIELSGNCCIYSPVEVRLNTKECNDFSSFKANEIIYNGYSFRCYGNFEYIDRLREERQKLVDVLDTIKKKEEECQRIDAEKYSEELKLKPLSKRLKK